MRLALLLLLFVELSLRAAEPVIEPRIDGDWWQIAGDPDLGKLTTAKQQPVDFTVWQAADGTWQLWSCIRNTATPGNTRLFHGWQGTNLTDHDWQPKGIMWQGDPGFGEKAGGVQSPFVTKAGDEYMLPARCPNLNAIAERFVRSIRESCLDRLVLIGESSLHRATSHFVLHYHQERNHQGLENKIIQPEFNPLPTEGTITCRMRLGGLLRYYYREAA